MNYFELQQSSVDLYVVRFFMDIFLLVASIAFISNDVSFHIVVFVALWKRRGCWRELEKVTTTNTE